MIYGVSDKRRFNRIGKIRLGIRAKTDHGTEYPRKIDYFRFDTTDKAVLEQLMDLYGETINGERILKPRRLRIAFPDDDVNRVFDQNYECWGASQLHCRGDGRTATRIVDKGERVDCECPSPETCEFAMSKGMALKGGGVKPGCQRVARLQFVITDLDGFGVWQIDTGSFNSIVNINSSIELLRKIAGRISWIEIPLVLVPQNVTVPDTGKKSTIYVLQIPLPISVRNFVPMRPLIEFAGEHRIERLEGPDSSMPTDLVPASLQIAGPQQTADIVDDDPDPECDPETGEITEPTPAEPTSVADHPEVVEAFRAANFPEAKRAAILASAVADGWTVEQLLAVILKHASGPKPVRMNGSKAGNGNGASAATLF